MRRLFDYAGEAVRALWRNKLRSILTMLGMIIGVAAVASVFGLSHAAASAIARTFSSGNADYLTIYATSRQDRPDLAALNYRDAAVVAASLGSTATRVIPDYNPVFFQTRIYTMRHGFHHIYAEAVSAYGNDSALRVAAGRTITPADVRNAASVCILTPQLAKKLFPATSDDAILGRTITINGNPMTVIGIYNSTKGSAFSAFTGELAILPYSTIHRIMPGHIDAVLVWPAPGQQGKAVGKAAVAALQRIHGARAKYRDLSIRKLLGTFTKVLTVIATSLTALGGISLLVAGIGIMNIMLVSVSERTREIGIRKAIGAKPADIVLQFLIEATTLSLIGGGIGLLLGVLIMLAASGQLAHLLGSAPVPYAMVLSIAFAFSTLIGLLFGVYPALRASKLDPIEALRS
ncbi:MAG: ABC transporter permease [Vulcanimicrobiaceae bacterium]